MAINLTAVRQLSEQLWNRLGPRTKLIGTAVLAFFIGTWWGGHGGTESGNGRYVPWLGGDGGTALLDTRTGQIWVLDRDTHKFKHLASLPYF